jgi:hypothetical protein
MSPPKTLPARRPNRAMPNWGIRGRRGDRVAVSWRAELTAANGKSTRCDGIDLFEFDAQGRIARLTGYWGPAAAFAALA